MTALSEAVETLPREIVTCIERALEEDIGPGDVTTNSIIAPEAVMANGSSPRPAWSPGWWRGPHFKGG
jgi:hypothetical protein